MNTLILPNKIKKDIRTASVALVFHICSVDIHRITKKIGRLSGGDLKKLDEVVKKMLKF